MARSMVAATVSGPPPSLRIGPALVVVPDGLRHARVEARVGAVRRYGPVHRAGRGVGEARADEARLHYRDPYAEAGDLEAEGVAQGLHGVLCGVVVAAAGEGEPAAHGGDVDDPAPPLPAHPRQHQLAHPHQPEHVGLELPAHLLHRDLLDRPGLAVARVVDEDADGALAPLDLPDGGPHGGLVRHVEREELAADVGEGRYLLDVSGGGVDPPAAVARRSAVARPMPVEQPVIRTALETATPSRPRR
jgi:hypothetical protein